MVTRRWLHTVKIARCIDIRKGNPAQLLPEFGVGIPSGALGGRYTKQRYHSKKISEPFY